MSCKKKNFIIKPRNLIIFFFLFSSLMVGILLTLQSFEKIETNLLSQHPPFVTLQLSRDKIYYSRGIDINFKSAPPSFFLSLENAKEIKELPYVKKSEITMHLNLMSTSLNPYFNKYSPFKELYYFLWENEREDYLYFSFNALGLIGSYPIAYSTQLLNLVDGRNFHHNDINKIIISKPLAEKNNLGLGSKIILENTGQYSHFQIEVEVIGLFMIDNFVKSNNSYFDYNRIEQLINQIYIPYNLAEKFHLAYYQSDQWKNDILFLKNHGVETSFYHLSALSAIFMLNDIYYLDLFKYGLSEILQHYYYWDIGDFSYNFHQILAEIEIWQNIFNWLLILFSSLLALISISILYFMVKDTKLIDHYDEALKNRFKIFRKHLLISHLGLFIIILMAVIITSGVPHLLAIRLRPMQKIILPRICIGCSSDAMRLHDVGKMTIVDQINSFQIYFNFNFLFSIYVVGLVITFCLILMNFITSHLKSR